MSGMAIRGRLGPAALVAMLFSVALGPAVLTGCGASPASDGWVVTVDTLAGGTVVVVNMPPSGGAGPTWVLEEELRIGSVDEPGPALFGQIKALSVLDDGRIAVLESQAQEVRIFAADGAHAATYGGRGGGPGEFENAFGLMRSSAGLLYVPDQRNARMSVIDPDRGFVTSYPLRLLRWGFVWDGVMREDDHIVVPSVVFETQRELLRVYAPDLTQVDSVLMPEAPPMDRDDPPGAFAWQAPGGMPRGFVQVPFYAQGARLLDRTGEIWTSAGGDPAYRIARWAPGGDTSLVLRTERAPVPVTAAERDSAIAAILSNLEQYGVTGLDASKVPGVKPGVLGMFTDDRGRLWVRTSSPDPRLRYDVYERDGRFAGSAATELGVVPWVLPVVRGDRVYAVVTDEMDVPYIIRARLVDSPQTGTR